MGEHVGIEFGMEVCEYVWGFMRGSQLVNVLMLPKLVSNDTAFTLCGWHVANKMTTFSEF